MEDIRTKLGAASVPVMEKELEAVKIGIYGAKAKDLLLKDLRVCW